MDLFQRGGVSVFQAHPHRPRMEQGRFTQVPTHDTVTNIYQIIRNCSQHSSYSTHTPWKINMEHNNEGLEDDFALHMGDL